MSTQSGIVAFRDLPTPLLLGAPSALICAETLADVRPAIKAVEHAAAAGLLALGFVSYEAAPAFDAALAVRSGGKLPLVWFALFSPDQVQQQKIDLTAGDAPPLAWQPLTTQAQYASAIASIQAAIAAGETYQVNYTLRLQAAFDTDAQQLFGQLYRAHPAPYAAFITTDRFQIISLSPELFFHQHGRTLTTRPMKGTLPRGRWTAEDIAHADWLATSEKNRAENLMIVDLLRNDLGRIAEVGSVHVPALFVTERYPTVWQLTSTVSATMRPATTLEDVFTALFPCGSVTGAPKISTMRLIRQLEAQPRELYCGAIGVVLPGGEAIFNVGIRTLIVDRERGLATYGVGGGITADSQAADEYAEALDKAAVVRERWPDFSLLETLRCKDGRYTLLNQHLARLADSAAYFAIPLDLQAVRQALVAQPGQGVERVRLLVNQQGAPTIERGPLLPLSSGPLPVALAAAPVSRNDRFLFHKTTHRATYAQARAAQARLFDTLLWNEQGELTEFTIGNLVAQIDGGLWTPPRESGLLGGVFRAVLLQRGTLAERVLHKTDLQRATRLWLINSVRGWVEVVLKQV